MGFSYLTTTSLTRLEGCWVLEMADPRHYLHLPRYQWGIPPTPVPVHSERQEVSLKRSPMGLRHCQAKWRRRVGFHSDPAVSPKRQLNYSCSTAHIHNRDLVRINNKMGLLVSPVATHLTFHGTDTCVRKQTLLSDLTKFKPRAPPKTKQNKMTKRKLNRSVLCQVFQLSTPPEL